MDITGRVAFVTGGASGIGRATVVAIAERGASVVFFDRDEAGARETIGRTGWPERVTFRPGDVTDSQALAAAVDSVTGTFGRLDIVANVAGIAERDLFADGPATWRQVIDIDLTALIDSTRLAVHAMRRGGHGGVIVNLASWLGLYPMLVCPVYSAAKAGVVGFSRALAGLADECGIRVNAICPELVDTPLGQEAVTGEEMTELRASRNVLTPEDVADWVIRVVQDDSRAGAVLQLTKAEGGIYVE